MGLVFQVEVVVRCITNVEDILKDIIYIIPPDLDDVKLTWE